MQLAISYTYRLHLLTYVSCYRLLFFLKVTKVYAKWFNENGTPYDATGNNYGFPKKDIFLKSDEGCRANRLRPEELYLKMRDGSTVTLGTKDSPLVSILPTGAPTSETQVTKTRNVKKLGGGMYNAAIDARTAITGKKGGPTIKKSLTNRFMYQAQLCRRAATRTKPNKWAI